MLIQEAVIESPEVQQAPEIPSPSADDQNDPGASGRYGWMALLAVIAIAVGLLVVQVVANPEPSFELDSSYAEAEGNRFNALTDTSGSDELDQSYVEAEQNRFGVLSEGSGPDQLDASYNNAEVNRFGALGE